MGSGSGFVFVVVAEVVFDHVDEDGADAIVFYHFASAIVIADDDVGEVAEKLYIKVLIFYSNLNWI